MSKIYEQTTGRRAYNGCQIPRTWDIYTTYVRLYISYKMFYNGASLHLWYKTELPDH